MCTSTSPPCSSQSPERARHNCARDCPDTESSLHTETAQFQGTRSGTPTARSPWPAQPKTPQQNCICECAAAMLVIAPAELSCLPVPLVALPLPYAKTPTQKHLAQRQVLTWSVFRCVHAHMPTRRGMGRNRHRESTAGTAREGWDSRAQNSRRWETARITEDGRGQGRDPGGGGPSERTAG